MPSCHCVCLCADMKRASVEVHKLNTAVTRQITEEAIHAVQIQNNSAAFIKANTMPARAQSQERVYTSSQVHKTNAVSIAGHGLQIPQQYISGIEMRLNELPPSSDFVASVRVPIRNAGSTPISVHAYISMPSGETLSNFSVTPSCALLLNSNRPESALVVSYCPSVVCDGRAFHRAQLCFNVNGSLQFGVGLIGLRTYVCTGHN